MWRHIDVQANWRSWTYGRDSTPLTFRRVLKRASPSTDTGPTFLRLLQQEAQRATYLAPEYNVPPFWQISQDGNFCLLISLKNTNLVEDVEILLPVKFLWIPFSGFREEVENVSANQRPGRPSCFSNRPEKHILGRGRWDLASCQVSLNSVQQFQRRSRKCEKLTTDRQTDDGRRTTRDHNSALEPSAQVH